MKTQGFYDLEMFFLSRITNFSNLTYYRLVLAPYRQQHVYMGLDNASFKRLKQTNTHTRTTELSPVHPVK